MCRIQNAKARKGNAAGLFIWGVHLLYSRVPGVAHNKLPPVPETSQRKFWHFFADQAACQ